MNGVTVLDICCVESQSNECSEWPPRVFRYTVIDGFHLDVDCMLHGTGKRPTMLTGGAVLGRFVGSESNAQHPPEGGIHPPRGTNFLPAVRMTTSSSNHPSWTLFVYLSHYQTHFTTTAPRRRISSTQCIHI